MIYSNLSVFAPIPVIRGCLDFFQIIKTDIVSFQVHIFGRSNCSFCVRTFINRPRPIYWGFIFLTWFCAKSEVRATKQRKPSLPASRPSTQYALIVGWIKINFSAFAFVKFVFKVFLTCVLDVYQF